ncbi:HTTM domain-containing protein [Sorangium sp. So ce176]|uniref:HTTM domain-containing protein n=1 Tax=Sorangium sp. So ce176 TaxID=3133286 RepID=UPI003F5E4C93
MRPLSSRADRFLFAQEASLARLAAIRASLGLVILVMVLLGPFDRFFGEMGPLLYAPRGLLAFTPVLDPETYWSLRVLVAASALSTLLGLATRVSTVALALSFLVLNYYTAQFTGISWNYDTHLNFFAIALCAGRSGARGSLDDLLGWTRPASARDVQQASFLLAFMQLYVALLYFQAGVSKLVASGLVWLTSGVTPYRFTITSGAELGRYLTQWPWIFQVFTALGGLFELAFLPLMLWRRSCRAVALAAMAFHLGMYLVMGISFWHLWVLYPALFMYRPRGA